MIELIRRQFITTKKRLVEITVSFDDKCKFVTTIDIDKRRLSDNATYTDDLLSDHIPSEQQAVLSEELKKEVNEKLTEFVDTIMKKNKK